MHSYTKEDACNLNMSFNWRIHKLSNSGGDDEAWGDEVRSLKVITTWICHLDLSILKLIAKCDGCHA